MSEGGESGLELCRRLRSEPGLDAIPVIFLTGTSDVDTKVEALDAGAVDYVTKPFDAAELRARVRAALRSRPPRVATALPRPPVTRFGDGRRAGELLAGRYELEQLLGAGGMGEVYSALDQKTRERVAVKLLLAGLATDAEVVGRLQREARAAGLVRHPNVVRVLDVGLDEAGVPFIVQALLRGETLAQRMAARGKMPLGEALAIFVPVTEAIAAAHAAGVVHRDLKPENVLLDRSGEGGAEVPVVLDFGLSKLAPGAEDLRLTRTGVIMGTPGYMSPEQIRGERAVGAASDVWSLGVLLYEMLSGRLPFRGEGAGAVFYAIFTEELEPLRRAAPEAPEALSRIAGRCLRRDPAERYADAGELLRDLAAAAG